MEYGRHYPPVKDCRMHALLRLQCSVGDDPKTVLMYFSSETQQDWKPGKREPDDAGGAFWLPGNVLLELHMVSPMSRGQDGDAQVTLQ